MKHRFRMICTIVVSAVCQRCVTTLDSETQERIATVFSAPDAADHAVLIQLPAPLAAGTSLRGSINWRSGSVVQHGQVLWVPSTAQLFFDPFEPLNPDLIYTLSVSDDLTLDDGSALQVPGLMSTQVRELPPADELPAANVDTTATIVDMLAASCGGCHNHQPLVVLDEFTLFGTSASDRTRPLVEPGEPAQSVLVDRIVPALTRRSGQAMPPAWSDEQPLTQQQVQRIEAWILAGCPDTL